MSRISKDRIGSNKENPANNREPIIPQARHKPAGKEPPGKPIGPDNPLLQVRLNGQDFYV
jgi:hypothetical protein